MGKEAGRVRQAKGPRRQGPGKESYSHTECHSYKLPGQVRGAGEEREMSPCTSLRGSEQSRCSEPTGVRGAGPRASRGGQWRWGQWRPAQCP